MGITMVITMVLNPISWDGTISILSTYIMCNCTSKQGKYAHFPAPPSATQLGMPHLWGRRGCRNPNFLLFF